MDKFDKQYFTRATTKEEGVFDKYANFLQKEELKLAGLSVCDIGCATGNFISNFNSICDCYGVDGSKFAIDVCKEKFPEMESHFAVVDLNLTKKLPFHKKFDLITMFDVIEHIDNLASLKELFNSSLTKGGYLLITTPNANNLLRFYKRILFTGEIDETHVNLFTPYTLDFFLRRSGFKKISISTPYNFYFKNNWLTKNLLLGGQIFALYRLNNKESK